MFEEFMGLPAHPLLVHAAVVFVPLLAITAVIYAFVPWVRPHTRWVLAILVVAAPVSALFAKLSGDAFYALLSREGRITEGFYPVIRDHRDSGNQTLIAALVQAAVTAALIWFVRPGVSADGRRRTVALALGAVSVVAAALSLYFVFQAGDSGASAVWGS